MDSFFVSPHFERERLLAEHLSRNDQAVTTAQLTLLGYTKSGVRNLVDRGRLVRRHWGVYRSGDISPTLDTETRCALLAIGETSALCLVSAAFEAGLVKYPPKEIQVAVPSSCGRKRRRRGVKVYRLASLEPGDTHVRNGRRRTTPERTILDLAAESRTSADKRLLRRALKNATVEDHDLPARLRRRLGKRPGSKGTVILNELLAPHLAQVADFRSDFEEEFTEFLLANGVPAPVTNRSADGKLLDLDFVDYDLRIELDTYKTHGDVESFEDDRRLDTKMMRARRRLTRITEKRYRREPDDVLDDVRELLRHGGWTG